MSRYIPVTITRRQNEGKKWNDRALSVAALGFEITNSAERACCLIAISLSASIATAITDRKSRLALDTKHPPRDAQVDQ